MLVSEQIAQAINNFIDKTNIPGYDGGYSIDIVVDGEQFSVAVNDSLVAVADPGYSTNLIINCVDSEA